LRIPARKRRYRPLADQRLARAADAAAAAAATTAHGSQARRGDDQSEKAEPAQKKNAQADLGSGWRIPRLRAFAGAT